MPKTWSCCKNFVRSTTRNKRKGTFFWHTNSMKNIIVFGLHESSAEEGCNDIAQSCAKSSLIHTGGRKFCLWNAFREGVGVVPLRAKASADPSLERREPTISEPHVLGFSKKWLTSKLSIVVIDICIIMSDSSPLITIVGVREEIVFETIVCILLPKGERGWTNYPEVGRIMGSSSCSQIQRCQGVDLTWFGR